MTFYLLFVMEVATRRVPGTTRRAVAIRPSSSSLNATSFPLETRSRHDTCAAPQLFVG